MYPVELMRKDMQQTSFTSSLYRCWWTNFKQIRKWKVIQTLGYPNLYGWHKIVSIEKAYTSKALRLFASTGEYSGREGQTHCQYKCRAGGAAVSYKSHQVAQTRTARWAPLYKSSPGFTHCPRTFTWIMQEKLCMCISNRIISGNKKAVSRLQLFLTVLLLQARHRSIFASWLIESLLV